MFVLQFPGKMAQETSEKNPRGWPQCTKQTSFAAATLRVGGPNSSLDEWQWNFLAWDDSASKLWARAAVSQPPNAVVVAEIPSGLPLVIPICWQLQLSKFGAPSCKGISTAESATNVLLAPEPHYTVTTLKPTCSLEYGWKFPNSAIMQVQRVSKWLDIKKFQNNWFT